MANTDDFISSFCARLDDLIASHIDKLVNVDRDGHDRLAGRIAALKDVKKDFEGMARKWRMRDEEEEDRR